MVIQTGTNDLKTEKTSEEIAEEIFKLANEVKNDKNNVIVSAIIPRADKLNYKGQKVTMCLKLLCSQSNVGFMENIIDASKHQMEVEYT